MFHLADSPLARPLRWLALATLLATGSAVAKPGEQKLGIAPLAITVRPIDHFAVSTDARRFGSLEFRGGLILTSDNPDFGGLSGLAVDRQGTRFTAVTDAGAWVTGRMIDKDGILVDLADASIAPMLAENGQTLTRRRTSDVESLTMVDGQAVVGIEIAQMVMSFPYARDGLLARGRPVPTPAGVRNLPANRGLEGLAAAPANSANAGALIAVSERSGDARDSTAGFIIGGPNPGVFRVKRRDDYDITDLAFTPRGDLLMLERWYSRYRGIAFRIREVPGAMIKPGAVLDGRVIIEAGMESQIDNMEGLAVSQNEKGETILTIVSDDNFSFFQRTLMLRFAMIDE